MFCRRFVLLSFVWTCFVNDFYLHILVSNLVVLWILKKFFLFVYVSFVRFCVFCSMEKERPWSWVSGENLGGVGGGEKFVVQKVYCMKTNVQLRKR